MYWQIIGRQRLPENRKTSLIMEHHGPEWNVCWAMRGCWQYPTGTSGNARGRAEAGTRIRSVQKRFLIIPNEAACYLIVTQNAFSGRPPDNCVTFRTREGPAQAGRVPGGPEREPGDDRGQHGERAGLADQRAQAVDQVGRREAQVRQGVVAGDPATTSAPRPSSWRYTMSIGENWLAPSRRRTSRTRS